MKTNTKISNDTKDLLTINTDLDIIISLITGRAFFTEEESSKYLQVLSFLFDAVNINHIKETQTPFFTGTVEAEAMAREHLLNSFPRLRELANFIMSIDNENEKIMNPADYVTCKNAINAYKLENQVTYVVTQIPADFKVEQPKIMMKK
jgi:hypothetical protein